MAEDKIKTLLSKGVEEVIKRDSLEKKLRAGKKLRIKYGADPSAPDLHLGHSVCLWKLKEFQDLGHQVIFIIGDFTGLIGDPSGRDKTRPALSKEEIEKNAKTYFEQAGKILDIKKIEIKKNSQWFSKMDLADFLKLAGQFTLARIIERDDFSQRLKKGIDIGFHETIYPLLQAYDSIMVKADVEVGGRDQKFNLLAGRELQKKMGQPEQDLMLFPLLVGADGKKKMSKSLGNYIGLTESANEQYGKIMSISDDLIFHYFELCARLSQEEIKEIKKETDSGRLNPRDAKARLAREIVSLYHGKTAAEKAEKEFIQVFREKKKPTQMPVQKIKAGKWNVLDLLFKLKLAPSKSEAKRLIEQGGVKIDGRVVKDWKVEIQIKDGLVAQVGKRKFVRLKRS
ncbi:MAG: tyrosine--tRNA ligase [Candidatus Portnoybacteria bacterium RIFCSPLOWO2_12_FULL_39_9]|uniref:Tyrosine--tRNA ligase n=1 Tax=Candidatus Portnoybacteria bacterium RIFCSPHIGHO2_12_FULL_38_9 TaxID=1801997 RepID=A0A1G2FHD3_9BACT|nr:MAG: tyrosine--tRNA ligase [Candidatus Portnoybacteria bacterium RBG_13_40_8]OGZ36581.1 MAG: tyrosine--tRNA ligase [Candidatus Portnoybacteria bacterium RIFCSPHIGHO2_02_FULL_39_12]OGZ37475.1 MAG: tyrosine--tRNA ligase [Candidatus Portnoybacteria bacterium RIFCSPHIGHO2_12_FULL_38_9]OGZ39121.1 MAG: tyrosine--tRNA ligase [Candidatus Portnoybacteria bacterium RIFCSPLOWO2_01_FULL_38_39]OGZ39815.1 MAG: tyrosine--tRNA ligase [Candidatus Portnoybacteria bacterium RIFCSPLOWO2_12_FULL_39_9]